MKLCFIRHGQCDANVLREITNRGCRHRLTALRRQQASELAQKLPEGYISQI